MSNRKPLGITLAPELLRKIAQLPTGVLVKHMDMTEAEATEFRLSVALAALGAPAQAVQMVARAITPSLPVEPLPTMIDKSPLSAEERLAAARTARGVLPTTKAATGGYVISVNGRYATAPNALDGRTLTPLLREADMFMSMDDAFEALTQWKDAPDDAQVVRP
jgi:hypothetical protein